jgi:hypothetical protein
MATQKIETGLIADSAVTTAKLADNSVTAAKIAAGSLDDQVKGISSSADAVAITIDSSENVGIGTDSPSRKVHIDGGSTDAAIQFTNTNTGSTESNGTYIGHAGTGTDFQLFNYETGYMRFGTAGSERMRIESAGTVKISHADTASEGLRVIQTTAARTSGGALGLFYDDQSGTTQPTLKVIQNGTGDILQLFDGGSQVVTVQDGGSVGIGTTSPSTPLHVYSNTSGVIATISGPNSYNSETGISLAVGRAKISGVLNGSGGTPGSSLRFYTMPNSGSVTERMSIDSAGSTTFTTGTNDGVKITGAENGAYIDSSKIADVNTKGTFIGLARPEDGNVTVHGIGTYDNTGNTKNNLAITSRSDIVFAGNDGEMGRFLGTGGLTFNGDTAAANALDDYEEGNWTPSLGGNVSASGQVYGTQEGTYTKIGRQVTCRFKMSLGTEGSFSNVYLLLEGFPFTVASSPSTVHMGNLYFTNLGANYISIGLQAYEGNAKAFIWGKTAATANREYLGINDLTDSTQFTGTFTYFV